MANNDITVKKQQYNFRYLELLRSSFGYQRLYLPHLRKTRKGDKAKFDALKFIEQKFETKSSALNTPIVAPLKIQISPKGEPLEFYTFPNEPIIKIRGSKKIVETDLDGDDGTFKQLYNLGDYLITIQGVAVNENYDNENYPEDVMRNLRTVYELRHHLEVSHPILNLFNIKYISFYDFNDDIAPGSISMVPFQFECKSDKDYKLTLKRKQQQ